jgi:hypothetical protein
MYEQKLMMLNNASIFMNYHISQSGYRQSLSF